MKCAQCKGELVNGQTAYCSVTKNEEAVCCSPGCREKKDVELRKHDLVPIHNKRDFKTEDVDIPLCHISAITTKRGAKGAEVLEAKVDLPNNVSIDLLRKFSTSCSVRLSKETLTPPKREVQKPEDNPAPAKKEDPKSKSGDACVADRNVKPFDDALWVALTHTEGAIARWTDRDVKEMSDPVLTTVIAEEFGAGFYTTKMGDNRVGCQGGSSPSFFFNCAPPDKPTLQGRALVREVRRIILNAKGGEATIQEDS